MSHPPTAAGDHRALRTLADVTEEMTARFEGRIDGRAIARIVRHCRRELTLMRQPASPEAVERLALKRLTDNLDQDNPQR